LHGTTQSGGRAHCPGIAATFRELPLPHRCLFCQRKFLGLTGIKRGKLKARAQPDTFIRLDGIAATSMQETSIALNLDLTACGHEDDGSRPDGLEHDRCENGAEVRTATEKALIAALCAGDESAYEALIDRFERPVYNLVARLTDDCSDAADMTQEVFLKIFRGVGSFRGGCSLKTWVYRIAVNEARNHRRWFSRHRRKEVGMEAPDDQHLGGIDWIADPGRSPLQLTLDHESHEMVEAALAAVNPAFREALVLREVEGLSYEEIAQIMDISLGTVKSRIVRGREDLRERLARSFLTVSPNAIWKLNTKWKTKWKESEVMAE
jgi:RNA polymerase sigma-70 factor (ECF subfamily)